MSKKSVWMRNVSNIDQIVIDENQRGITVPAGALFNTAELDCVRGSSGVPYLTSYDGKLVGMPAVRRWSESSQHILVKTVTDSDIQDMQKKPEWLTSVESERLKSVQKPGPNPKSSTASATA